MEPRLPVCGSRPEPASELIVLTRARIEFCSRNKIENLPDGQTRGIEVDLMSSSNTRRTNSRPVYESVLRENLETSFF